MRKILIAVFVLALLVLSLFARQRLHEQAVAEALPVNERLGGELGLDSTTGRPLTLASLQGKVVLLDFGYTTCPDVCPTVLARLRQVLKGLGPDAGKVQVVFVSFDPARDTLDHLRQYLGFYDPRFIGATGSDAAVAAAAKRYGAVYIKDDQPGSAGGYAYTHSDYIYLLDTQGRVRKLYDNQAPTTAIQADIHQLLPQGPLQGLL